MTINSDTSLINASDDKIFSFLSDFNNFGKLMPEQIINWQSTEESCSFTIKGMADLKMKMIEKTPNSKLQISSESSLSLSFTLTWNIKSIDENQSEVNLDFDGNLNPMVAMMAKNPLQNFVNVLVQKLGEHFE